MGILMYLLPLYGESLRESPNGFLLVVPAYDPGKSVFEFFR